MLVIRLARTGKKKQAYFRIVVAEKQRAVGSKFVEILGNYNPHKKELKLDEERLAEYLKNGAQPSNTLAKLLKNNSIKMPKWVTITERNRPAKKVPDGAEAMPGKEEPAEEKKEVPAAVETEAVETEAVETEAVETEAVETEAVKEENKEEVAPETEEAPAESAEAEEEEVKEDDKDVEAEKE